MSESFHDDRVVLHCGDCIEVIAQLEENSIDAVVCDPPYHLTSSIVRRFDAEDATTSKFKTGHYGGGFKEENDGTGAAFARMSRGFMGKAWDGGDIAFRPETWAAVLRVLKPGGHLLACGGTRTYHRLACAIEDAGFEIRDCVMWVYGQGFPKSHDVSKGIDRAAGAERERSPVVAMQRNGDVGEISSNVRCAICGKARMGGNPCVCPRLENNPITDAAKQWDGWGTSLKPSVEPCVLARKSLSEATVAANVLRWGTGALNVDGCRIGVDGGTKKGRDNEKCSTSSVGGYLNAKAGVAINKGRWPANLVHDGSPEVITAFPETQSGLLQMHHKQHGKTKGIYGAFNGVAGESYGDSGSAARFFYTVKADAPDRLGSSHPTVKPVDLMQWLCRLVTPPNGTILDPFSGTGTTGEAAFHEGFRAILIEKETEYQEDIRRRMKTLHADRTERKRVHKDPSSESAPCVWE